MLLNKFPGGGVDVGAATAQPSHVLAPQTFFAGVNEAVQTGTIPSKTAQTYTPGTAPQTIAAGQYLSGDQTIPGDPDLVAANIKTGKDIFGVIGAYGVPAAITAGETILYGKVGVATSALDAYVDVGAGYGITALKAGTYRIKYDVARWVDWYSSMSSRLTKNGVVVSESEITADSVTGNLLKVMDIALAAGDVLKLQFRVANTNNKVCCTKFLVCVSAASLQTDFNAVVAAV